MNAKRINLTLPAELLKRINEAAKANYASRSDYIRESVVMRLKSEQKLNKKPAPVKSKEELEEEELMRKHGFL